MLVVLGSLLGFAYFYYMIDAHLSLQTVYKFYNGILVATTILTLFTAHEAPGKDWEAKVAGASSGASSADEKAALHLHGDQDTSTLLQVCNQEKQPQQQRLPSSISSTSTADLLCGTHAIYTILSAMKAAIVSLCGLSVDQIREGYWIDPVEHHDFFVVTISRTFYYMGASVQTFLMYVMITLHIVRVRATSSRI